ncbi:MAG: SUMF1/EgtB/PvdO family nonheme iron enzyme [Candidatus Cloacimonetes bacterium]|nr:SUMF1/EgtB/PvdO family nonheme iron enzyme [Candidatus Cloacimonadota bacterium]MDD4224258.1 SUMF1/EgtB/PvdO family nonheme iron enzyme [Candidatus Cloacimonadota bacterium]
MKKSLFFCLLLLLSIALLAQVSTPIISNTTVAQRTDGSKLVDITYDLYDANGDLCEVSLKLSSNGGVSFDYIPDPLNLSGDIGENIAPGTGKTIVWNAGAEGIDFDGSQFMMQFGVEDGQLPIPENFVFVQGGTIYPADGSYTSGLTVSSFYIDKYELTNTEWNAVMGSGGGDTYPHAYVSWFDAVEYCNRRSMIEGLPPCYSYNDGTDYGTDPDAWPSGWNANDYYANNVSCDWNALGYRLPSTAEWDFAARGGLQTHGYSYSGSNDLNIVGWYDANSGYSAHPVGQLAHNELGTYDMSGNLWEWNWDNLANPNRILRGGSYSQDAYYCQVLIQASNYPTLISPLIGFRICRVSP